MYKIVHFYITFFVHSYIIINTLWFEKKKLKLHNEQIIEKKIISNYNKIEQEIDYTMNLLKQL